MTPPSASADRAASTRRTTSFFRPRLEALEDRTLLANHILTVPGPIGQAGTFRFDWRVRDAQYNNEVGVYVVDGAGRVDGIRPGDARYLGAVLRSTSRQVLFDSSTSAGNFRTLSFTGGTRLAFYLIQDTTNGNLVKQHPAGKTAFFSVSGANGDGFDHVRVGQSSTTTTFAWEDLTGGGDRDFNDVVFNVRRTGDGEVSPNFQGRALLTPGKAGQVVSTNFGMLRREAGTSGEIGLFAVDSADGRIGNLKPGDPGYEAAALNSSRRVTVFAAGQTTGVKNTIDLPSAKFFGIYVVRSGTAAQGAAGQARVLWSFGAANAGDADLMRQFQDTAFGFETGGSQDFKDVLIKFGFATPRDPRDTAPPTLTAQLRNDTGSSNSDRITNDPTVTGSVSDPSGIRSLRAGFDSTASAAFRDITSTIGPDGNFTISASLMAQIAGGILPQGNRVLHLEAIDTAGNVARFDLAFNFTQTAPTISFDLDAASDTAPVGDQVTQQTSVTLKATTTPGASVLLVQRSQTVVADSSGVALFTGVPLNSGANDFTMIATDLAGNQGTAHQVITRNDAPTVANGIADTALDAATTTFTKNLATDAVFADANIVNSIARFTTSLGQYDVELFDTTGPNRTTPENVANFLKYVAADKYNDALIHRVPANFVVQGGGFTVASGQTPAAIPPIDATVVHDEVGNLNLRGTIAMAKNNSPDSATTSWFVNLQNNSTLDDTTQANGGFTAFGKVLGNGMAVLDAINAVNKFAMGALPFEAVPLLNTTTTPASFAAIPRSNYVFTNDVSILQQKDVLTFSVQTDQPAVATASIDPVTGLLTVTRVGPGSTTPTPVVITVTATDSHGASVPDTFTVNVS